MPSSPGWSLTATGSDTVPDVGEFRLEDDSVARTVQLLSDRWTFLIMREAFHGVRRFGQMARDLGVSRNILSRQLRTLVDHGVLERHRYRTDPDRFEYVLSDGGRDLYPAIVSLMQWGDRYLTGPEGPALVLRHRPCGHLADPLLVCAHCGERLDPREVDPEPGPGAAPRSPSSADESSVSATGSKRHARR
jgi:DNA-binding HxlR family transcriptional regulator